MLLPFDLSHRATYAVQERALDQVAARRGIPLLGFMVSDSEDPIEPQGAARLIVYRTSIRTSKTSRASEFSMPGFCDDIVDNYLDGTPVFLPFQPKPSVGFIGLASPPRPRFKEALKASVVIGLWRAGYRVGNVGKFLRGQALRRLSDIDLVDVDTQLNSGFYHFVPKAGDDQGKVKEQRNDFVENMLRNPYVLALRGNGNYSFRFFETLCVGRIPVLVEAEGRLPLDDRIDYRKHAVVIPYGERQQIAQYISDFHAKQTPESFEALQRSNRELWQTRLSPEGFFPTVAENVRNTGDLT